MQEAMLSTAESFIDERYQMIAQNVPAVFGVHVPLQEEQVGLGGHRDSSPHVDTNALSFGELPML